MKKALRKKNRIKAGLIGAYKFHGKTVLIMKTDNGISIWLVHGAGADRIYHLPGRFNYTPKEIIKALNNNFNMADIIGTYLGYDNYNDEAEYDQYLEDLLEYYKDRFADQEQELK